MASLVSAHDAKLASSAQRPGVAERPTSGDPGAYIHQGRRIKQCPIAEADVGDVFDWLGIANVALTI
jgi:hypothetical protein